MPGLQQQDFTILNNKKPQTISSFGAPTQPAKRVIPLQTIVLVDTVNPSFDRISLPARQSWISYCGKEVAVSHAHVADHPLRHVRRPNPDDQRRKYTGALAESKQSGLRTFWRKTRDSMAAWTSADFHAALEHRSLLCQHSRAENW